jgi:hypothetical protein
VLVVSQPNPARYPCDPPIHSAVGPAWPILRERARNLHNS